MGDEDATKYLAKKRAYYEIKLKFTDMLLEKATKNLDKSKQYLKMMEKDGDTDKIIEAELKFRKAGQTFSQTIGQVGKCKSMLAKVEKQEQTGVDFKQGD